jgi:hypothetical protein
LFPTDSVILDYTVEEVREYKYLGHEIRITTDNQTQEELRVERRTSLGWAAYDELKDVFNSEIPISLKRKVYDQCVFPVQTLTFTLTKKTVNKLRISQRKMGGAMSGMKLKDRMRNTSVRQKTACMI